MLAPAVVFLCVQFLGSLLWTYVTASFVDVIANHDPDATASRQQLLALNRYCSFFKLPKETCKKLRTYFRERKRVQLALSRQTVAEGFSPRLQAEVAWVVNKQWLRNISFLNAPVKDIDLEKKINWPIRDRHQRMLVQVAMAMRPDVYEPKEAPPARRLYVIYQGAAYF